LVYKPGNVEGEKTSQAGHKMGEESLYSIKLNHLCGIKTQDTKYN
jgi:hypothetical protein